MTYPLPENESSRLKALSDYAILDTLPEQAFDDLTRLATYICDAPIALISLVDEHRQWFKSRVGLDMTETPREQAFCAHAIINPARAMIINDATLDERFMDNPLVTGEPHIRFYAGAPLVTPDGQAVGTLCIIDRVPHKLTPRQLEILQVLSRQVVAQLEMRASIMKMEQIILDQEQYTQQLVKNQQKIQEELKRVENQSLTDGLTGAGNRIAFQNRLEEEFDRARRYDSQLSLIMLDMDNFKILNDEFGHLAGDAALRQIVQILQEKCRVHDLVARFGGEEFAIILPNTGRAGALVLAERFRRSIQQASWPHRSLTASLGGASLTGEMTDGEILLARADEALYQAKQTGRNRVCFA